MSTAQTGRMNNLDIIHIIKEFNGNTVGLAQEIVKLRAAFDSERTLRRIHDACRESAEKEVEQLRADKAALERELAHARR